MAPTSTAGPITGLRSRSSGSSGLRLRASTRPNAASIAAPSAIAHQTGVALWLPVPRPHSSRPMPAVRRITLRRSMPASTTDSGRCSRWLKMRVPATRPIGRLIRKIHRQPMVETKTAPSAGPITAATAHMLLKKPCSRARCGKGKMSPTSVKTTGWMQPAPTPCRVRKAMSAGMPGLAAHSMEAITKIAIPVSSTRRRP